MKQLKKFLAVAGMALALGFTSSNVSAQGNFDPEQMRQRMMERYREMLEIKGDDEWKAISGLVEKVNTARRDVMAFGGGGFGGFGGRGGRDRGGDNANNNGGGERRRGGGFFGEPPAEATALRAAIENKASADEIKAKMAKFREARKAKETELTKAQEDLRKVLSVRQEAAAVTAGLIQ